eukprot:12078279-Karenia_brevis.AAC.1
MDAAAFFCTLSRAADKRTCVIYGIDRQIPCSTDALLDLQAGGGESDDEDAQGFDFMDADQQSDTDEMDEGVLAEDDQ